MAHRRRPRWPRAGSRVRSRGQAPAAASSAPADDGDARIIAAPSMSAPSLNSEVNTSSTSEPHHVTKRSRPCSMPSARCCVSTVSGRVSPRPIARACPARCRVTATPTSSCSCRSTLRASRACLATWSCYGRVVVRRTVPLTSSCARTPWCACARTAAPSRCRRVRLGRSHALPRGSADQLCDAPEQLAKDKRLRALLREGFSHPSRVRSVIVLSFGRDLAAEDDLNALFNGSRNPLIKLLRGSATHVLFRSYCKMRHGSKT